ncbi:unnamed protein product [Adineta ricciae]|uniref:Uncharacterized protein n=1 Tax=Adineta ricciae TaxID=249248 RepID=A0A815Z1J5_ADIRI|nr:unnamed protein product [Adineta ricciae]CAF1576816.1 unnamed protein product [Adineta ricciae]
MYNTDDNRYTDRYCLMYHVERIQAKQIIAFCLRTNSSLKLSPYNNTIDHSYTFAQLRQNNISSEMLLSWSATIDLAERYDMFLNKISSPSKEEPLFYNCSKGWFGSSCRFSFDLDGDLSWGHLILLNSGRATIKDLDEPTFTCYTHLQCKTSWLCLDWRNICDRAMDCDDGSDEIHCWQLEMNECEENEYRCHNGQCIPEEFFNDDASDPDCADTTDEPKFTSGICDVYLHFGCEETSCIPGSMMFFPCGDGQCAHNVLQCANGRDYPRLNDLCSIYIICSWNLDEDANNTRCLYAGVDFTHLTNDDCPPLYSFLDRPILFQHVYIMLANSGERGTRPRLELICYDERLCGHFQLPIERFNGSTCLRVEQLRIDPNRLDLALPSLRRFFSECAVMPNESSMCNETAMYRCLNSTKCISKHRLVDGICDCPGNDDEMYEHSCSLNDARHRFSCVDNNKTKCHVPFDPTDVDFGVDRTCKRKMSEYYEPPTEVTQDQLTFQIMCDGTPELNPIVVDGREETDETGCEFWPCNNVYTRCDGWWMCANGADEVNCPDSICPGLQHACVFPNNTTRIGCLPLSRAGDGTVDCLGGSDEQKDCFTSDGWSHAYRFDFRCLNSTECIDAIHFCNTARKCPLGDDENFCASTVPGVDYSSTLCKLDASKRNDVENFFCAWTRTRPRIPQFNFRLENATTHRLSLTNFEVPSAPRNEEFSLSTKIVKHRHCHRGLRIRIRMDNGSDDDACLCSPSYYGDRCQYQNQRVSLTIQIRVASDWQSVFTFTVKLIDDNDGTIESHDFIDYLPIRDCNDKVNLNLLFASRPKSSLKNYSVRIDGFNRMTMTHRASWIFPLRFAFLPVYRLAALLKVPVIQIFALQPCEPSCEHGQCLIYANSPSVSFCQCHPGWSGVRCDTKSQCDCASDSLCVGDSICVCPPNRFGPHCFLTQSLCETRSCRNGGQCVLNDVRYRRDSKKVTCVCPDGFFGEFCEHQQMRLDVSFHRKIAIPSSLFVHFINVRDELDKQRTTTLRKVPFDSDMVAVYNSEMFYLAIAQLSQQYYLLLLQSDPAPFVHRSVMILPDLRCPPIDELFNTTIVNQHIIKRIKLYHLPCLQQSALHCFHDSEHFCICEPSGRANCIKFDYNMTYDCRGHSPCENAGQCLQNGPLCPMSSFCVCQDCYVGSRCHLPTHGFSLSLDLIFGYQIRPHVKLDNQKYIVKLTIVLTTLMFAVGFLSSVFSMITVRTKTASSTGCGLYLFASSVISLIMINVLIIKFAILIASQIGTLRNRTSLSGQCRCLDFLLRVLLSCSDWLSACVAIERAVTIVQGVAFDKAKSKRTAKWVILLVMLFTVGTHIHDPLHRGLVDDEEESRTFCIAQYTPSIQVFDRVVNALHFFVPLAVNCFCALIVIIAAARRRSKVDKKQSNKEILREQIKQHKHLLISPTILAILAVPRLIISFLSECMKSPRNARLYVIGYFISFAPPMSIFVVFIVPSQSYMNDFIEAIQRWRTRIARTSVFAAFMRAK